MDRDLPETRARSFFVPKGSLVVSSTKLSGNHHCREIRLTVTATAIAIMAPRVQWTTELVSEQFIVPRLEDELIDDLFYQEDEIGEMRHTAFMIECGLEEDPPDGPDVPPVPWGDMLLKQQQQKQEEAKPQKQSRPLLTDSDSDSDDEGRRYKR